MTCWVVRSLTLSILWTVTEGDTEVSCVFMESCILPCSFQPIHDVIIHWIKEPGNTYAHSYFHNQDLFSNQDQSFKGRTSLFTDQISRGNASLQLTGVKVQDQSRYKCYTSTNSGNKDLFISLKVDASVTEVNIQQVENRIICSSEGIYPEPELTWSISPPSNMTFKNTTTVQQTEQQLYSISSTLIPPHSTTDVVYSCTVSTRRNKREATLMQRGKEEDDEEKTKQDNNNPSNTAVIAGVAGGLLVIAAIAGLTAFCVRKRSREGTGNASGTPEAIRMKERPENRREQTDLQPNEETGLTSEGQSDN